MSAPSSTAARQALAILRSFEEDPAELGLDELERFTEHTVTTGTDLATESRRIRERGWAVNVEERYDGVVGVAAPVMVPARGVVAAIGVQGPAVRMRPDDATLVRLVERAAQGVATCLASGLPLP